VHNLSLLLYTMVGSPAAQPHFYKLYTFWSNQLREGQGPLILDTGPSCIVFFLNIHSLVSSLTPNHSSHNLSLYKLLFTHHHLPHPLHLWTHTNFKKLPLQPPYNYYTWHEWVLIIYLNIPHNSTHVKSTKTITKYVINTKRFLGLAVDGVAWTEQYMWACDSNISNCTTAWTVNLYTPAFNSPSV